MKEYTVIYERGKRNWSAYVPDLPGCVASGKTRRETAGRMRGAIAFHLEGLRLNREPIPEPNSLAGTVCGPSARLVIGMVVEKGGNVVVMAGVGEASPHGKRLASVSRAAAETTSAIASPRWSRCSAAHSAYAKARIPARLRSPARCSFP